MSTTDGIPLDQWPQGRVGYVALIGRPNAGKSTLLNQALGYHLAAVSARPQTTRTNCRGILSDGHSQVIFVDTPGAHKGPHELGRRMFGAVSRALEDADVVLCLADPTREQGQEAEAVAARVTDSGRPVVLVVTKRDISTAADQDRARAFYRERLPEPVAEHTVCAFEPGELEPLLADLRAQLPEGPFLYDPEQLTDTYLRDIGAEVIRETIMELYEEEVPHCCHVEVDEWKEDQQPLRVAATIHVERASQKGMIIGKKGSKLRQIGSAARGELEKMMEKQVVLKLFVRVQKNWSRDSRALRKFGY
mgnify:CR=1 FL=1